MANTHENLLPIFLNFFHAFCLFLRVSFLWLFGSVPIKYIINKISLYKRLLKIHETIKQSIVLE